MPPFARPIVFTTDVGGGGGAPPADPQQAATARIEAAVAAGMADDDPGAPVVPGSEPPLGTPAPPPDPAAPVAGADDDLEGIDFSNLNYRDGKRIESELKKQRERFKPFADAFGGLDDDKRSAAVEALSGLGAEAGDLLPFVASMNANDRQALFAAYSAFLKSPAEGYEAFRRITDAAAAAAGIDPAAQAPAVAPVTPAGTPPPDDDPDRPITRRELEEREQARTEQAARETAEHAAQDQMLAQMRDLGYDHGSSDPEKKAEADELIWLAAYRTEGDVKKADALLKARNQRVIDGYVNGKKADASRPGAPETGATPSGQVPPEQVDPDAAMRARLDTHLGPDPFARRR